MGLGERLKTARNNKGLTQKQVAAMLDVDTTTVSKWEINKAEPNNETMMKLSSIYGVGLTNLMDVNSTLEAPSLDGIDPELSEVLRRATPEQRQRVLEYLTGNADAPVNYTDDERGFLEDSRSLTVEDLMNRYSLKIGEREATPEEVREAVEYIKARRIMRLLRE